MRILARFRLLVIRLAFRLPPSAPARERFRFMFIIGHHIGSGRRPLRTHRAAALN